MQRKYYLIIAVVVLSTNLSDAQENYEIQVYASPTTTRDNTILELHSNFTFQGEKSIVDKVIPSYHALHETLEITHGFTNNFEIGFYFFTNDTNPYGYKVIGSHIRPRVSVPEKWHWPVGASLSTEFGYQRRAYSTDTWNIELRPIVDKQWGNFYLAFNPTFEISLKSDSNFHTPAFAPNIKASIAIQKVSIGIEYYGDLGLINNIPKLSEQSHALFVVVDLYFDPRWEINIGPGFGLTTHTDGMVFKVLVGRRINWKNKH